MNYWFKGMRSKIEKIVRNCISCILAERKSGKQEGCLHRTQIKTKEDLILKDLLEEEEAAAFLEKRSETRRQAKEAIAKIQEEIKRSYDRKRKAPSIYKENDLVAIKRTQGGPGLKFAAKYFGPYRIKRVLRNDRYIVQKIGEGEGPRMTSSAADHMKPQINTILEEIVTQEICETQSE
ncbi:uncharacterized protein LOC114930814, partial [Nylanderia fulva]|uniref:uncharacterized protein LOC114930814 n=1 Tax=Nylanderia fulva TaxID=613905 RepID=UPI0010FBB2B0